MYHKCVEKGKIFENFAILWIWPRFIGLFIIGRPGSWEIIIGSQSYDAKAREKVKIKRFIKAKN